MQEKIDLFKKNFQMSLEKKRAKLYTLKEKLEQAKNAKNESEIDKLTGSINELLVRINYICGIYNNLRMPIAADVKERLDIFKEFSLKVDKVIPDDVPLVFHGNNNLGIIEEIMKTGGLFTPDERGVNFSSFAEQIDVTFKNDIRVSLEFAEPSMDYIVPYGAIFVFWPREEEQEKVLNTHGSEVSGGVQSVDFRKNPERLFAIITTNENIEGLQKVAKENGIDENLIVTHEDFLKKCREKFPQYGK